MKITDKEGQVIFFPKYELGDIFYCIMDRRRTVGLRSVPLLVAKGRLTAVEYDAAVGAKLYISCCIGAVPEEQLGISVFSCKAAAIQRLIEFTDTEAEMRDERRQC